MKAKRVLCAALVVAITLSFAACNKNKLPEETSNNEIATTQPEDSANVTIESGDNSVSIGSDGITIKSGDSDVSVGSDGVSIKSGDSDVSVGSDNGTVDAVVGNQTDFEKRFTIDGTLSDSAFSPHFICYSVSDKTFDEVLEFIKKGMKEINATSTMESEDEAGYSFNGKYNEEGFGEKILIVSVSYDADTKMCDVSITY